MKIIVLSRGPSLYSTQRIVNTCYHRGHDVRIVDHLACDLVVEENRLDIYYRGERLRKVDAVIPRVGSGITHESTSVLRQFELNGAYALSTSNAILKTKDKFRSLQLMAAKGISIPKSMIVNYEGLEAELVERLFSFPIIVKLMEGTHGRGVVLSESMRNLQSTIDTLYAKKHRLIVQDFIQESEGRDIRVIVVGRQVVASMQRVAKEGEFRSNLHMGGTASPIRLTEEEKLLARKATQVMGLGMAGVDILRTKERSYVLEVNASPGLEGIETVTGIDVAGVLIQYLEKQVKRFRREE